MSSSPFTAKIFAGPALNAYLDDCRSSNLRLVCTNGVFDLMHIGHLYYLSAARELGDRLIVGVNSDESTRRIKGPTRPLIPETERAEMLAALECVDCVTIFPEDTACELIRNVHPDIYVKGGDYSLIPTSDATAKPLPEATIVREYGGEIALIPYIPDHSTTALIERIVARYR
jgi:D-glycero-beta-D-manno-heptose 1-phosphate adenylyltransferase